MTIIAGRKQKDALLTALLEAGVHLVNTTYAHGAVRAGSLTSALGLVPEKDKAVITCVLPDEKSNAVFAVLAEKFHFDKPGMGMAFTMPVDRLSF
jgi:nitrogen regulatory protein PII